MKILYDEMMWPEVKKAVKDKRVPLIPVGSTEQHGPHLPTKTDAFLAYEVCKAVAAGIPEATVVMPSVNYGYNEHHLDFPATIHIDYETLIKFIINIGKSLAHHGFERIIIVNGHGSNTAPMELAARRITLETPAICASLTYLGFNPEVFKLLEGESGHAGELETSLMLYLQPDLVDMSAAAAGDALAFTSPYTSSRAFVSTWTLQKSKSGSYGDPTVATAALGRLLFEKMVAETAKFIRYYHGLKQV